MNIHDASLIFMAADKESFDYIQSLNGQCLFYEKFPFLNHQILAFCHQREVWVLYALPHHFSLAMQLARKVQLIGSHKTFVMLIKR